MPIYTYMRHDVYIYLYTSVTQHFFIITPQRAFVDIFYS